MDETCWFCKNGTPDPTSPFKAPLYRDPKWFASRKDKTIRQEVRYTPAEVAIPRCASCARRQRKLRRSIVLAAAIALAAWLALLVAGPPEWRNVFAFAWGSLVAAFCGAGAGFLVGMVFFRIPLHAIPQKYPAVVTMLGQGWEYGTPNPSQSRLEASVRARKQRQVAASKIG